MSDPNRTQALSSDPNRTQLGVAPTLDPNRTVMGTAPTLNATVTIKPVQCTVCKTFNPAGVMFCVDCGLIFDRALPSDAFGAPAVQLPMIVEQSGREQPIRAGTNVIGREGDVMIVDGKVSRRHAQIHSVDSELEIEDLGSTNGTKVDGSALGAGEKRPLVGGETISLGGYEVKLSMPGASGANATAVISSNKTAAIATPPKVEVAPATLVGESQEWPLRAGLNSFGRKSDNDVTISDPYVSGKHGVIEVAADGFFITDIGSTNGTLLNDAKLSPNMRTAISESDEIRLGSIVLKIRSNEKADA
jgi:pSer/pThr/pTyr-binding forkhead associated (FHA) protein